MLYKPTTESSDDPGAQNMLFISHTESDSGWVERQLIPALMAAGLECHYEALFSLGKPRLLEFEEAIKQSERILLICSPAYFADESLQLVDLLAARHGEETKSWPVIPIIRHAVELPLRLRILESLDATDQASWPDALTRLCKGLMVDIPQEPKRPRCPYPGMKPFERDSEFPFYGRQDEVGEIIERLRLHPFLAVIGASGSGKSSLVHAGLIPELSRTQLLGEGDWLVASLRPSQGSTDSTLTERLGARIGGRIDNPESAALSVRRILQVAREATMEHAERLLLVVDQFEEVYTLQNERDPLLRLDKEQVEDFQWALLRLAAIPECLVVLTIRADFFDELMESPIWEAGIREHRYELTTLGTDGLRQAIVQPALDNEVCISDALVERILSEAGCEPGILPFLQETLVLLWGKMHWRHLSIVDYESMLKGRQDEFKSGLEVAMAQRADAAIRSLSCKEHRSIARRLLLRLVQFGEGHSHTRRQQTVAQLSTVHTNTDLFRATLNHLADERLITLGADNSIDQSEPDIGRDAENGDALKCDATVDISHDQLINGWPTLKTWIHEQGEAESMRRKLQLKVETWIQRGRSNYGNGLLDLVDLRDAEEWIQNPASVDLGTPVGLIELVDSSRRFNRVKTAARIGTVVACLLVTAVFAALLLYARHQQKAKVLGQLESIEKVRPEAVSELLTSISGNEQWTVPHINQRLASVKPESPEERRWLLANARYSSERVDELVEYLPSVDHQEFALICRELERHRTRVIPVLSSRVDGASDDAVQFRWAAALASLDPTNDYWSTNRPHVARLLLVDSPLALETWMSSLKGIRSCLIPELSRLFGSESETARKTAAIVLADFVDEDSQVVELITAADARQFPVLLSRLNRQSGQSRALLRSLLENSQRDATAHANAIVALALLGDSTELFDILRQLESREIQSHVIEIAVPFGVAPRVLFDSFIAKKSQVGRYSLLLALASSNRDSVDAHMKEHLADVVRTEDDPGVRSAAVFVLATVFGHEYVDRLESTIVREFSTGKSWHKNSLGQVMIVVSPNQPFAMGTDAGESGRDDDETEHLREIPRHFAMSATETTKEQFLEFKPDYEFSTRYTPEEHGPINNVTWYLACQYCNWLSDREGLVKCYPDDLREGSDLFPDMLERTGYRLPTEAEWAFACRAGSTAARHYGDSDKLLASYGWFLQNSSGYARRVGRLKPNRFGLFDMHGNMWEWCQDEYKPYPNVMRAVDRDVVKSVTRLPRVLRGGTCTNPAASVRSGNRWYSRPTSRIDISGFRVVRTVRHFGE